MNGAQKAIIPGIFLSCVMLLLLNRLVNPAGTANAATEVPKDSDIVLPVANPDDLDDKCDHQERYPAGVEEWCGIIESNAAKFGLDPLLIAAVMKVESGGQPEVISSSGAVGLMQVMPSDGIAAGFQCINGPCFAGRPTIAELMDPAFNVMYGARMLAGLIERNGSIREGLRHYGPYDVGYWYADLVLQHYGNLSG